MRNIAVSPCSNPEMSLEEIMRNYSGLGYKQVELFTSWAKSAVNVKDGHETVLQAAARYGLSFSSLHLPQITDNPESVDIAVQTARYAAALGVKIVLFKAKTRELYIRSAGTFLDAIGDLDIVPVLQNHKGTAITTLDDFQDVIEGINDKRMKTLLEVGHFHSVGVSWREGCDLLGESIALVHIKDQIGAQSVPFGTGEINLPGLFKHMESVGYGGNFVVEMEVADKENTLCYLGEAYRYLESFNHN
jgi:sugar phosphate isomerase/epimerase